jgi:peptidyl-prolyl cis-trans isomerase SurA
MLSTLQMVRTRPHDRARPMTSPGAGVGLALAAALLSALSSATLAQQTAKASPEKTPAGSSSQSIVVLVNDEPITGYEVEERMKIALLGATQMQERLQKKLKSADVNAKFKAFAIKRLEANPPKTEEEQQARVKQLQGQFVQSLKDEVEREFRPEARKEALDELIEERLKLQEAKRLNVIAGNDAVDRVIAGMAERNKMTPEQFAEHVGKMGANIAAMRERIKASLSWGDVIRRRFGHQIATAGRELDKMTVAVTGGDDVALHVHRILLPLPAKADQKQMAQRLSDAERLRAGFTDCAATSSLAASISGARFDDLGERRPSSVPEPTRSLLLSAGDNQMLPPSVGEGGVEVWVLCGRKAVKAEEQRQATAETDVRQKEFEILSKKHLKDLRQDAHIEYR